MDSQTVVHQNLSAVSFSFYTPEELKQLSVLQITNIEPFDGLGHATAGGLYDERLGPCKRFDICATCRSSEDVCEGHVGHVVLPLPVMNPILMPTLELLMKFTCMKCLHLRVDRLKLAIHLLKIETLDFGLDYLIDEVDDMVEQCVNGIEETDNMADLTITRLRKIIRSAVRNRKITCRSSENVRTVVEKKKHLLKDFWNRNIGRSCPRCKERSKPASLNSRTFFMVSEKVEDVVSDDEAPKDSHSVKVQKAKRLRTDKVRQIMRSLWKNEQKALRALFPFLDIDLKQESDVCPTDVFFWDVLNVSASRFQPLRRREDRTYVHEKRAAVIEILKVSKVLEETMAEIQSEKTSTGRGEDNDGDEDDGETVRENEKQYLRKANKVYREYDKLQVQCNLLYNSEMNKSLEQRNPGVIQGLEKKEGLFRNNMMGKRVNFAARTVISPDPYITANELGIPVIFALKLTYPQYVTPFNLKAMQKAVLNGPDVHPGAVSVRLEDGYIVRLKSKDGKQRKIMSERLETAIFRKGHAPIVYRHLVTGDVVLFNRQPTLHKPSIMAHIARILPGEKTFRMHYSNCKAYNADFDGDEMNVHFPQSELARAEAYEIASVNHQYLTPKDGTPLSGLIQDHIVAAALLSVRGTFFSREDYHELVYGSLSFLNQEIRTVPPAVIAPKRLWTGKQLITTLILNVVPSQSSLPTVMYACKVKPKAFVNQPKKEYSGFQLKAEDMCESQVVILKGELVSGIIDKSSIGNQQHGLIHVCYEIYGGQVSTNLLTAFARLSTNYLQCHIALTLGIEDILVIDSANNRRSEIIDSSKYVGRNAVLKSIATDSQILTEEMIHEKMQLAHTDPEGLGLKMLDSGFKGETDEVNNQISSVCLEGLQKKFPQNNLQLMIQAGAKGGTVNALQISCLLGQIELEGRRVPLMMSGKTLPSFVPYDTSPRAGGFIAGRFLTGIRPQEFFFHCMAGREGLVDTAVKTASSGYLQRCIIKHLEGLMVNYDMTVRDSDGSIIQFLYGEDGLDVTKSQLISPSGLPILIRNRDVLQPTEQESEKIRSDLAKKRVSKHVKKIRKWESHNGTDRTKHVRGSAFLEHCAKSFEEAMDTDAASTEVKQSVIDGWFQIDRETRKEINMRFLPCPDPVNTVFCSDQLFGSVSERIEQLMQTYVRENPDNLLTEATDTSVSHLLPDIEHHSAVRTFEPMQKDDFISMYCYRHAKATCEPGEPVGVLVGHSIGEPSTQMTLNTFHFAGRGEMNVTLGIPRLREILMHASDHITTPSMDIPFRSDVQMDEKRAAAVRLRLNAVKVSDVLQEVEIKESLVRENDLKLMYEVNFEFLRYKYFKKTYNVNPSQILAFMESRFIPLLRNKLYNKIKLIELTGRSVGVGKKESTRGNANGDDDEDGEGGEEERRRDMESAENAKRAVEDEDDDVSSGDEGGDGDTLSAKRRAKQNEETDFQEPEDDEEEKDRTDVSVTVRDDDADEDGEEGKEKSEEEDPDSVCKSSSGDQISEREKQKRIEAVVGFVASGKVKVAGHIREYDFDAKNQKWCRLVIVLDLKHKLDMASLVQETAKSCFIHKIGQIRRAFLVKDNQTSGRADGFEHIIKTEGVSFLPLVRFLDTLDLNRVYSNDIQAIAKTYGIEAGGQAVRREIRNVFAVYGIAVDPRHLSLIADYMTFSGEIRGMNRRALSYNSSPLQQMTFESTAMFMKEACLTGLSDDLMSPSASIFAGIPPKLGTGSFDLHQKVVPLMGRKRQPARESFSSVTWSPKSKPSLKRRSRIVIPIIEKKIKF